jgi:3-oxoacyl-[acyl-carrier protein] reductase
VDLGIAGKRALVCASSKGLGKGCALALAADGVHVTMNGRTAETLEAAAEEARALGGGEVRTVCCDITTEEGRAEALSVAGELDILVNNAGGPPPGDFRDWGREEWLAALDANMLTPIELIKASVDGMCERGYGRIVNITSSSVKSPIPTNGVTINGILPGPFDTERLRQGIRYVAEQAGRDFEQEFEARKKTNPAGRYGNPQEFGALCAFLCSAHAGYINGQNIVIDGGGYPGTL